MSKCTQEGGVKNVLSKIESVCHFKPGVELIVVEQIHKKKKKNKQTIYLHAITARPIMKKQQTTFINFAMIDE